MQSKPQNPPRRHHYIPEFFQRQWASGDYLTVYQNRNGRVVHERKSPKATGYTPFLYGLENFSREEAQIIETEFMQPVDAKASIARDRLLERQDLSVPERGSWVQFILSLLLRSPEELQAFKDSYRLQLRINRQKLAEQYVRTRSRSDPETYDDYLSLIGPGGIEKNMMKIFLSMISNKHLTEIIGNMSWTVVDVSKSAHKLLASDRPILMPYGLGKEHAYLAMPISPSVIFLAMNNPKLVITPIMNEGLSKTVAKLNAAVVGQACKYVYAADESQTVFIKNRISRLPRYSYIERMTKKFALDDAA